MPIKKGTVKTSGDQKISGKKEFTESLEAPEKITIPLNEPDNLENGCIWID